MTYAMMMQGHQDRKTRDETARMTLLCILVPIGKQNGHNAASNCIQLGIAARKYYYFCAQVTYSTDLLSQSHKDDITQFKSLMCKLCRREEMRCQGKYYTMAMPLFTCYMSTHAFAYTHTHTHMKLSEEWMRCLP